MELDKRTHWWWPEGDEREVFGFKIIHVYLVEMGDSVLGGFFFLEFFRVKLLDAFPG